MTAVAEWTEVDSRTLTARLVAVDGHRMRLLGADRIEAIRLMVDRGLDVETIAMRLQINTINLRRIACYHGLTLPSSAPTQPWWVEVACPSSSTRARRRQKAEQRARQECAA